MKTDGINSQVHRFHDNVAAYLGDGSTVYMTPSQARAFGTALIDAANDVDETPFINSTLRTFNGETLGPDSYSVNK